MIKKITVFIFGFLVITNKVEATQFNLSPESREFIHNLTAAQTIAVGTMWEDNSDKQFMLLERGWTKYPTRVDVDYEFYGPDEGMQKAGIKGMKYIFFSVNKTDNKGNLKPGLSTVRSLRASEEIITKLAGIKKFFGEINPSWQFCEYDNECMLSKNQCGNTIGVNKKYEKDYLSFLKTKKGKIDCSKVEMPKSRTLKCVGSFCF